MNRFMKWLAESFAPTMNRWFSKPWLAAVSNCMQKIIPFILTGSLIYFYNVFVSFFPSLNDIEMLKFSNIGVCMGNGDKEVKKVADFVTKSIDKNGLYYAFVKLKLL